jgi:uncharacterized protein (DUF3084 family)
MKDENSGTDPIARIDLFLNDSPEPFSSILPPARVEIDTSKLDDGPHELRLQAYDTAGNVGRRTIPFVVQNGPGITVTGCARVSASAVASTSRSTCSAVKNRSTRSAPSRAGRSRSGRGLWS